MKKVFAHTSRASLLMLAMSSALVSNALAQTNNRLDNFDLNIVQVNVPQLPSPLTPKAISKTSNQTTAKNAKKDKNATTNRNRLASLVKPTLLTFNATFSATARYAPPAIDLKKGLREFTTGSEKVDRFIVESGARNGVDPLLLYSVMHQESSFKPTAMSNKGAAGLMQLMPGTASRSGVRNRFDPQQSVEGGARYIRFLLDYFGGNVPLTLAGYNAGEGAVLRYGRAVPPYRETQEYVRRIATRYNLIRNPQALLTAATATKQQLVAAVVAQEKSAPLIVLEDAPKIIRLPNGNVMFSNR